MYEFKRERLKQLVLDIRRRNNIPEVKQAHPVIEVIKRSSTSVTLEEAREKTRLMRLKLKEKQQRRSR